VDVREQHDHVEAGVLQVDELVRGEQVAEVEHAGGLVADVRSLPVGVLGQRSKFLLGHDFRRVPREEFVGVHTTAESTLRVKRFGCV